MCWHFWTSWKTIRAGFHKSGSAKSYNELKVDKGKGDYYEEQRRECVKCAMVECRCVWAK